MLKQRVLTALVLLALLLPALFYVQLEPFLLLTALFVAAASWEWARLAGLAMTGSVAAAALLLLLCFGLWYFGYLFELWPGLWRLAGAVWLVAGVWLLKAGVGCWQQLPPWLRLLLGLPALCLTWLALAQLRLLGVNMLLSVLALVWAVDIGAYFAGRAWGGRWLARKLAPTISPGKSWEGVAGGMVLLLLLALVWPQVEMAVNVTGPSFYGLLMNRHGWVWMLLAVLLLAAISVVGDLLESLVKRGAGVKDSSALLPGHGGVLDRIDALLPTLPLAMMLLSF